VTLLLPRAGHTFSGGPLGAPFLLTGALVRRDRGFTLIELLMVVVIIGILMTVLIPRWANSRQRAFMAALKSDLRNLATAQEAYFFDYATYTTNVASLPAFSLSPGNVVTILQATSGGWSATASRSGLSEQCYLFMGSVAPVGVGTVEGQVACQ